MFHRLGLKNNLDFPTDIFLNESPKISVVSQSSILRNNYVGPETGSSVSFNKIDSFRKSTAEAIERRSSMLGANIHNSGGLVETWDIVNNKKGYLDAKYTRILSGVTDTTATAVHSNSSIAVYNAIKELLEKNSLFLFWYGSMGFKIEPHLFQSNKYFIFFTESGFKTSVFINDYFSPLVTVIVIVHKENDLFICGLGTDTLIENALMHAFEEAFLIGYMQYYSSFLGLKTDYTSWSNSENIKRIYQLEKLDYGSVTYSYNNLSISELISKLPNFIKELHVIYIEQKLVPSLKCVRVYSKDLINCLPLKGNIDLSSAINKNTISMDYKTLEKMPECPMS